MMHTMGASMFWWIAALVLWALVLGGTAWAAVVIIGRTRRQPPRSLPSPLDILERRFAAGEITAEQFDEARARLREHQLDI
ncbi:SHOCT domain-containing protein [Kribbella sp. NPDC048915]|uniref:SHOCT domain-containing protein n=1 Tax=Kribbella sp. NPDC048915 TaxID=3155148 RepID=UPI0033E6D289